MNIPMNDMYDIIIAKYYDCFKKGNSADNGNVGLMVDKVDV